MQLVMNNKRLLSPTIDKQINITKNQKRLLSETIESQEDGKKKTFFQTRLKGSQRAWRAHLVKGTAQDKYMHTRNTGQKCCTVKGPRQIVPT